METPGGPRVSPRARRVLRIFGLVIACLGAAWQLSLQARLYAARVRYPWDIEWLESSWLYQAYRVMRGMSTYGPPRDGYLPTLHPPLYPAMLGALGKVFGLDYGMARTVAFLTFLGVSALVVRALVRKHEGELEGYALGALAIGIATAGAPLISGFYDLIRGDLMAVALSVIAAVLVDGPRRMPPRRIAAVAAVLTAIVYTRLPAVFFPVWIVIFVLARHWHTGVLLAITTAAMGGLVLVALQYTSQGWYWIYTVSLLQNHTIIPARILLGFKLVAEFAPFVIAIPLVAVALAVTRRLSAASALWLGMLAASIPATLVPFAKVGGFSNDFMPVVFMIGPATALLVSDAVFVSDGWPALARRPRVALALQTVLLAAGAAFLFLRTWDFKRWVPTEDLFRRARALNARVASLEGGVLVPRHPFTAIHNGLTTLEWSDMSYLDMVWSGYGDLNLGDYIDKSKAKWAVVMGTEVPLAARELSARFHLEGPIGDAPATVIGERSQMRYLLRRSDEEKGGRVLFDFEKDLSGWVMTGDAFSLTTPKQKGHGTIYGSVGEKLVSSFHPTKGDKATGTLTSPKFVIDRSRMSLRVGGWKSGTRVELRVAGRVERKATGIWENNETMIKIVWELGPLVGKEAQLVLIDQDSGSWGHLLVDQVVLF